MRRTTRSKRRGFATRKTAAAAHPSGNFPRAIEYVVVLMLSPIRGIRFNHLFGFRAGVEGLKGIEFGLLDAAQAEASGFIRRRYARHSDFGLARPRTKASSRA